MHSDRYSFLKFVRYQDVLLWDNKRYFTTQVSSTFPLVRLGNYINEESLRYSISDATKTYGILGVNNQIGIFDAYKESGSKIKQKYKKMQVGWLAYNPYRINVGSIGIRTNVHHHEYISPAYVVFSCKEGLLPEFLFLLMKTDLFNKIIRENTTGSVRQNLNFSVLSNLQIPLLSLEEQNSMVANYNKSLYLAYQYEQQASDKEDGIHQYINKQLGIKQVTSNKLGQKSSLQFIKYKDTLLRWDIWKGNNIISSKYNIVKLQELIQQINTGTTPSTKRPEYFCGDIKFYTPSDIDGNMYLGESERTLSQKAIVDKKAHIFQKGDLLFVGIGSTVGKVGVVNDDMVSSNQQITGFTLDTQAIIPEYAFVYMNSNKDITTAEQSKTTLPIVNQEKIKNIHIPLPPLDIQNKIVAHIKEQMALAKQLKQKAKEIRAKALEEFENEIFG